jgi:sialic acid synthase SpsE
LLHCVSSYPCTWENSNINRIKHLKRLVDKVGFSDHSPDITPSVLALTYGLDVIEKHFTIDNKLPGRDNENSILPSDLKKLKYFIEASESILSLNESSFQKCELDVRENYTGRFDD